MIRGIAFHPQFRERMREALDAVLAE